MTLMSARVQFLAGGLSLIHIPLHLYPHFVQPILRLLFLSEHDEKHSGNVGQPREPWASLHPFLNISVTPVECSVVCSRRHADELFLPLLDVLGEVRDQVSITADDYIVIQVDGEGVDAGRRVVELTSPLALAGISIFFITTYFSDYILVPSKSRDEVTKALERRGFVFEKHADAFVNHPQHYQHRHYHDRTTSSGSSSDNHKPPHSPPPSNLEELQQRTFSLLKRQNVVPTVDADIRIIQCAGNKDTQPDGSSAHGAQLQMGLVKCFVHQPNFLSLTLTDTEPASLLLEKGLLAHFDHPEHVLLGSRRQDVLIPITLDLRHLPLESTGIVCGVAGRLVGAINNDNHHHQHQHHHQSTASSPIISTPGGHHHHHHYDYHHHHQLPSPSSSTTTTTTTATTPIMMTTMHHHLHSVIDMSYLSTARAGTVMVAEGELDWAIDALRVGEENGLVM